MKLNNISYALHAKHYKKRLGRGIGSGLGKTSGRGHKGQKSRSGGFHKMNFEGGQMPIQRRLPKIGFRSRKKHKYKEITLNTLSKFNNNEVITIQKLKEYNIIKKSIRNVKIICSGFLNKSLRIRNIHVTPGARLIITKHSGIIEEHNT